MELYHVINRGIEKRNIFLQERDYFRFIHDLFEFNDKEWVNTTFYQFKRSYDLEGRKLEKRRKRKLLVDILAFCLMPNHYHLLLTPRIQNGISKFMQKLNAGYVKYFNLKYERKGTLFEGRYKAVHVKNEAHFIHLPYYIHFNPLDLRHPEWRQRKLYNLKKAIEYLGTYRWSSHMDYLGKRNFPSVTNRSFLLNYFGGEKKYKSTLYNWLKELSFEGLKEVALEDL